MIDYVREVPYLADETTRAAAIAATVDHVRAHLSAVADADDDPQTRAEDVEIEIIENSDGPVRVVGRLAAERVADYDAADYDPYAGVPEDLRAEARR